MHVGFGETCWILAAGRKVDYGDEAVETQLKQVLGVYNFSDVGRVRTGAGAHRPRPLPSAELARGVAKSWCFGEITAVTLSMRLT